ncbi:hypothetical protein ACWCXE_00895 [Streptomyces sp. NPDC001780]
MDNTSALGHPPPQGPRDRRRIVAIALGMVTLTAGWPLISLALSDREPVRQGTVLWLGPGRESAALRIVGDGWQVRKAESDPDVSYALSLDGVDLVARYVALASRTGARRLWAGLGRVQSVADQDSHLGGPRPVTSSGGASGLTGALARDGRAGTATLWLPPGASYAVEVTVLAKPGAGPRARADASATARSVAFLGGGS